MISATEAAISDQRWSLGVLDTDACVHDGHDASTGECLRDASSPFSSDQTFRFLIVGYAKKQEVEWASFRLGASLIPEPLAYRGVEEETTNLELYELCYVKNIVGLARPVGSIPSLIKKWCLWAHSSHVYMFILPRAVRPQHSSTVDTFRQTASSKQLTRARRWPCLYPNSQQERQHSDPHQ